MRKKNFRAPLLAVAAAAFYALNVPFSKGLLAHVPPVFMASLLYLGAGVGVGLLYVFRRRGEEPAARLSRADLPAAVGMIVLDILAPVFLMLGLRTASAANASLLGNFEIAATALFALAFFGERISAKLWAALALITASSAVLSFEGAESFRFSAGSLLVLLAACCWGLENNCTRRISGKSTYQIVTLKGLCCGAGSFALALAAGETLPEVRYVLPAMLLGFVAYGMSIFVYIRAQRELGAARTSAYYALAPFIGTFLSFLLYGEPLSAPYFLGLLLMLAGTAFTVLDTLSDARNEN